MSCTRVFLIIYICLAVCLGRHIDHKHDDTMKYNISHPYHKPVVNRLQTTDLKPQSGHQNSTLHDSFHSARMVNLIFAEEGIPMRINCSLHAVTPHLYEEVVEMLRTQAKLLEYHIEFSGHEVNPMTVNAKWTYKANQWARVAHSHGQTILSLAFNYGILSLMTLSFGVVKKNIELEEKPFGCLLKLNEHDRIQVLLDILLRDFKENGPISVFEGESVCHQMIKDKEGFAKFTDQCCFKKRITGEIVCTVDVPNMWLTTLEYLIAVFTLIVFFFAPMICTKFFYAQTLDTVRYIIKLKEPLYKTICICRGKVSISIMSRHVIDLRSKKRFFKAKRLLQKLPSDTIIPIKVSEFDILVNYAKLLPENNVPVGVLNSLASAIFFCKVNEVEAFNDCCEANALGCLREGKPVSWLKVFTIIGRVFLVLFMPFAFYIRLVCYYMFENPEVMARDEAAARLGLPVWFEYRVLQYLTPIHPIFIAVYIVYFCTGVTFAVLSTMKRKSKFHNVVTDSLKDLINMSWLSALEMMVKNFLWPFKKMGVFGMLFGLIYWPLVMPICVIACAFFCIPLIFLACRLLAHAIGISTKDDPSNQQRLPGEMKVKPTGMQIIEADELLGNISKPETWKNNRLTKQLQRVGWKITLLNFALALLCIAMLLSMTLMFTEVVSFILHIGVFTMMGIIVNAGKVLKYGTLIFLVILYSYDCYNNVYKQYLKLNKALFSEIKGRIKDIMEVTSLPSHLQENRGFKAVEASEQADYESPDDICRDKPYTWTINDLVLFVDNDDFPRIPKKLFEDVCQITVPGSPGPVYLSLLMATGKFLVIIVFLVFVFIVVLSFGNVYQMSGTNQMLATMAGGFMPFMFSKILKPVSPDIELGSVSFKSKLEEVIINFWQVWPMFDLPFDIEEKEEEEDEDDDGSDDEKGSDKGKKDKKDKKDKDKKDKGKDKKNNNNKGSEQAGNDNLDDEQDQQAIDEKLKLMKSVGPADGQFVDIVIIVPDKDPDDDEWLMEWSSMDNFEAPLQDLDTSGHNGLPPMDDVIA